MYCHILRVPAIPTLESTDSMIILQVDIGMCMELEHLHYVNVYFRSGFHGNATNVSPKCALIC